MRKLALAFALALAVAPAASAGGWATAGLGPPADGVSAGDTWRAEITLKQHGVRPLDGVEPTVIITDADGRSHRFAAKPTDEAGVYVANVKFPHAGTWNYAVDDDFSQTHTYPAVEIGGTAAAADGSGVPRWTFAIAVTGLLLIAAFFLARRVRPRPEPAL